MKNDNKIKTAVIVVISILVVVGVLAGLVIWGYGHVKRDLTDAFMAKEKAKAVESMFKRVIPFPKFGALRFGQRVQAGGEQISAIPKWISKKLNQRTGHVLAHNDADAGNDLTEAQSDDFGLSIRLDDLSELCEEQKKTVFDANTGRVGKLEERIAELGNEINSMSSGIKEAHVNALKDMQAMLNSHDTLARREKVFDDVEHNVKNLQQEHASLKKKMEELESAFKDSSELQSLERELALLRRGLEAVEFSLNGIKSEMKKNMELVNLQTLSHKEGLRSSLQENLDEFMKKVDQKISTTEKRFTEQLNEVVEEVRSKGRRPAEMQVRATQRKQPAESDSDMTKEELSALIKHTVRQQMETARPARRRYVHAPRVVREVVYEDEYD